MPDSHTSPPPIELPTLSPLVDTAAVAAHFHVSRMTICRWRQSGRMPKPVFANDNCTLWRAHDILTWDSSGRPWCHPELRDDCSAAEIEKCSDAAHQEESARNRRMELSEFLGQVPERILDLLKQADEIARSCEQRLNACRAYIAELPQLDVATRNQILEKQGIE